MTDPTPAPTPRDPLHGVTLEKIVTQLFERFGWEAMAARIPVRCFELDPSVKSSLTFLRKTPWAREKVEAWYVAEFGPKKPGRGKPAPVKASRPRPPQKKRARP